MSKALGKPNFFVEQKRLQRNAKAVANLATVWAGLPHVKNTTKMTDKEIDEELMGHTGESPRSGRMLLDPEEKLLLVKIGGEEGEGELYESKWMQFKLEARL